MIEKLPEDCTGKTLNIMTPRPAGKTSVRQLSRVAAIVACMGFLGADAYALALGRISVLSALGEPLRAEIDIPDINADEAGSLRANVGSVDAFRRAGLEFNPLLSNVQVNLQRRPDGRAYLQLTGDRSINEPYLDLVVETNWAAGRLVRDYTLLFDPPSTKTPAAQLQVTPVQTSVPAVVDARVPTRPIEPAIVARPATPRPPQADPVKQPAKEIKSPAAEKQIKVRPGDTALKIAASAKPASVSLDQMLVALLRANPDAFTAGNVNRLKAGAVLSVPTEEAVKSIDTAEANQVIAAHSKDFNEFRRKLAEGTPISQVEAPKRVSAGKVQAHLEEKKQGTGPADKLSLQKGGLADKSSEDKLAKALQAKDESKRLAELNKNIAELQKLSAGPAATASAAVGTSAALANAASGGGKGIAATPPVPAASVTSAVASTTVVASSPANTTTTSQAVTAAASAPTVPASAASEQRPAGAVAAASAPAPAPVASAIAPAVAVDEPGLVSDLLENPLIPAVAGSLVALLAGLGIYRVRQRKKSQQIDSSFMESRLQPDSFFGASGGQKIDTDEAALSVSSMMYSPSQLDAGADVDPVAEADVYLAYGRDLQAEEILKEALRSNPGRAAIHFKLLQIYGKRRDVKSYAVVATDAYKLSRGLGHEWTQACDVGRELDPTNPLYQGDAALASSHVDTAGKQPTFNADDTFASTDIAADAADAQSPIAQVDLDLDLDFSEPEPPATPGARIEPTVSLNQAPDHHAYAHPLHAEPSPLPDLSMDLPALAQESPLSPTSPLSKFDFDAPVSNAETVTHTLDFDTTDVGSLPDLPSSIDTVAIKTEPPPLEFDMGSLSLDLAETKPKVKAPAISASDIADADGLSADDPLVTKLALAEEFQAIGDDDGARTLAQEVADSASGNLKAKAQRFLAELG